MIEHTEMTNKKSLYQQLVSRNKIHVYKIEDKYGFCHVLDEEAVKSLKYGVDKFVSELKIVLENLMIYIGRLTGTLPKPSLFLTEKIPPRKYIGRNYDDAVKLDSGAFKTIREEFDRVLG